MEFVYVLAALNIIADILVGYLTLGIFLVDKGMNLPLAKKFYDAVFSLDKD